MLHEIIKMSDHMTEQISGLLMEVLRMNTILSKEVASMAAAKNRADPRDIYVEQLPENNFCRFKTAFHKATLSPIFLHQIAPIIVKTHKLQSVVIKRTKRVIYLVLMSP